MVSLSNHEGRTDSIQADQTVVRCASGFILLGAVGDERLLGETFNLLS
jgi:hypothetical protein